jgi:branched-subunit amino acid ABC-type transport system permease component
MNADLVWPFLLVGISTGGLYALLGAGCVLAYRASGFLHIANSGIAMMAAFLYVGAMQAGSLAIALPISLAFGTALAAGLYRLVFRRLERADLSAKVVVSVAAGIGLPALGGVMLINFGLLEGGADRGSASLFSETNRVEFFGATLTHQQAVLPIAALVVVGVLQWALHRTDLGLALRASAQNPMSAELAGVPAAAVTTWTWAASGFIAALVGVLSISASSLLMPTYLFAENIRGLAASLTGGFVDLRRMSVAAFALGVVESELVGLSAPWNEMRGAVSFALITVVALFGLSRLTGSERPEVST